MAAQARARLSALGLPAGAASASALVARQVWAAPGVDTSGAVSPDGHYLSFVDWETGDLAILELATGAKRRLTNKGSWETAEYAYSSRISPDGKQVAYGWFNKDWLYDLRVLGLNGAGPRVLYRNEEVGYLQPTGWSPDGSQILAVLSRRERAHQIALVSTADGSARVLKTVDWRYPQNLNFSPDGRYIAYDFPPKEDSPERDIYLLSADGSRETHLVDHPAHDFSPVWLPNAKGVLFTSDRTGTLDGWVIQVADGKPQGQPRRLKPDIGRMMPLGFTRKGSLYYGLQVGIQDVHIARIDVKAAKILEEPKPLGQRFANSNHYPEWSPDGQYLAYNSKRGPIGGRDHGSLYIRELKTSAERELPHGLDYILPGMRWSPDGRYLLVTGAHKKGQQGLYRIQTQTGATETVVHEPGVWVRMGVWAPDAKSVFYFAQERATKESRIVARDLETGQERICHRGEFVPQMAISPDGRRLAYGADGALKVLPTAGGQARELFKGQEMIMDVAWTPDGRHLVFARRPTAGRGSRDAVTQLWVIPAGGGQARNLGLAMGLVPQMRWHPDGQRIAFTAGQSVNEVWVMENLLPSLRAAR